MCMSVCVKVLKGDMEMIVLSSSLDQRMLVERMGKSNSVLGLFHEQKLS